MDGFGALGELDGDIRSLLLDHYLDASSRVSLSLCSKALFSSFFDSDQSYGFNFARTCAFDGNLELLEYALFSLRCPLPTFAKRGEDFVVSPEIALFLITQRPPSKHNIYDDALIRGFEFAALVRLVSEEHFEEVVASDMFKAVFKDARCLFFLFEFECLDFIRFLAGINKNVIYSEICMNDIDTASVREEWKPWRKACKKLFNWEEVLHMLADCRLDTLHLFIFFMKSKMSRDEREMAIFRIMAPGHFNKKENVNLLKWLIAYVEGRPWMDPTESFMVSGFEGSLESFLILMGKKDYLFKPHHIPDVLSYALETAFFGHNVDYLRGLAPYFSHMQKEAFPHLSEMFYVRSKRNSDASYNETSPECVRVLFEAFPPWLGESTLVDFDGFPTYIFVLKEADTSFIKFLLERGHKIDIESIQQVLLSQVRLPRRLLPRRVRDNVDLVLAYHNLTIDFDTFLRLVKAKETYPTFNCAFQVVMALSDPLEMVEVMKWLQRILRKDLFSALFSTDTSFVAALIDGYYNDESLFLQNYSHRFLQFSPEKFRPMLAYLAEDHGLRVPLAVIEKLPLEGSGILFATLLRKYII